MRIASSRRTFLGAAAGLGALPRASHAAPRPVGFKLGVATYSLRAFDRPTAIQMLQKMQVKYVSIKDFHLKIGSTPAELKAGRAEFDQAGLVVTSGGNVDMTRAATIDDLRKLFDYARNSGLPMMVCAPTHENIKLVETLVKEYDIRIAIHNHGPEDKNFPSPQSVLEAVRSLDRRCGLCMDIGHSARAGSDVVKTIAEAGDRLFDVHVKDLRDLKARESQCDIGDGAFDFPAIFKALRNIGFSGYVNLEYEINEKDPMMGMQRSLAFERGVLAALAEE
jgi:sugar phosphate isomerase/epimerase